MRSVFLSQEATKPATFVLLYFVLFFSVLSLVFVVSVLDLSSVTYFPACTNVNGSVYPNCADVLMCC